MNEQLQAEIIQHASEEHPRECCGLLIEEAGAEVYIPCRNIAKGTDHFILAAEDFVAAEMRGEVKAIVHSHPDASPKPSEADRAACEASGLPWHIVGYPCRRWETIIPSGYIAPLEGRKFAHGVHDCYSIIRDFYKLRMGIELINPPRKDEWWKHGENIYVENYDRAGFHKIDISELVEGDVIIMQIESKVPNHAAIYLEGDKILHHLYNQLSAKSTWGGYWRKHATHFLRYGNSTAQDNPRGGAR